MHIYYKSSTYAIFAAFPCYNGINNHKLALIYSKELSNVIDEPCTSKQESDFSSSEAFEEFKLEFYEALLDLVEDLRRIKSERQSHQAQDEPKPVGTQL